MIRFQHHLYQKISNETSVSKAATVPCSKDQMFTQPEGEPRKEQGILTGDYTSGSFTH